MKIKIKKYSIGLLVVLSITATSCKKYLDEKNYSNFDKSNYFQNAGQAQAFVKGIYTFLYMFQNGDAYGESPFITIELFAGHATSLGQSVNNGNVINQRTDAVNPGFETVWRNSYSAIANANLAIERIPAMTIDESLKKNLLGQAYFLRAFFYYHLVRLYGDVPLIVKPVEISDPDLYASRAPQADVYKLIIADLEAAKTSGLSNTDQTGLVSLGAVKTLLASVYLTTAGYPLKQTENYAKAASEAKDVLPLYTLFTDYAYLHDNAHKNQGELIFQINYLVGIRENAIPQLTLPFNLLVGGYGDHLGAMIPTNDFFNSYETGDLRTQERQFYFSSYPKYKDPSTIINFGSHALYKYFHVESAADNGNAKSDENWTLLRLPEAQLIYAEASNEVNGPTQDAYDAVNAIRTRAKLANLSGLTKDQFRIAIWKERYHELAYENKAYFDVQRTHQTYNPKTNTFGEATSTPTEQGVTFKEQYYLWPIPQREIATNKNLTQNPGW
ncbi:RagB/SusD family nutrient uptake outer membrane protein [Mucilaginibacter achroorhodeus]|uniref:RagB/SusD family nutrient uptake outer membrane protein n=1 Tax=Mucilaginibacter achroorhodeus TaxID=2599294 RepID=A0A563U675_9SPHI|nr:MULTISPECIES: RagB/SusD family nutrient uptake outer membrane protein [Mucilaginibacter]QXV64752.1 RagB/SusD family nutrient uptake outer membrane protein [Mucilaginibacter sp. 21P]TWR26857.1 RagB/SusD family nutrient uptake outer membrane protein [Mucilaginibacter achroorhodeus]